jgi:hypothetical protein
MKAMNMMKTAQNTKRYKISKGMPNPKEVLLKRANSG